MEAPVLGGLQVERSPSMKSREMTMASAAGNPSDRIRVVVRVRPPPDADDKLGLGWNGKDGTIEVSSTKRRDSNAPSSATPSFRFDDVFGPEASQTELFQKCGVIGLIDSAIAGYSCTAFAFGQTGSGKTHTISGTESDGSAEPAKQGMMQQAIACLFDRKRDIMDRSITFAASYIEIYKEQVVDLLGSSNRPLAVRWKPDKGFHVEKLMVLECNTEDDLLAVLEEGLSRRKTASHQANERSSRSHSILTVYVQSALPDEALIGPGVAKIEGGRPSMSKYDGDIPIFGSISFVDLAGSERVKVTKAEGEVLAESNTINKSLLALGNCISALSDSKKRNGYIPYRDSVLTMLLKDSLGGTSRALMIACVSPTVQTAQESTNTLRYASRAKRIQNKPELKVEPRQLVIVALRREVAQLQSECEYLRQELRRSAGSRKMGQTDDDEDDSNDLAVVTRELVETKGILQKFMADNQDLHRENVRLLNQNDQMARQYEHLMQENEMLLRSVQRNREATSFERSTTQGTLWQQQASIMRSPTLFSDGAMAMSRSVMPGALTSDRLQLHDLQMKIKGIDRSDNELRNSLEMGLAARIATESSHMPLKEPEPRSPKSLNRQSKRLDKQNSFSKVAKKSYASSSSRRQQSEQSSPRRSKSKRSGSKSNYYTSDMDSRNDGLGGDSAPHRSHHARHSRSDQALPAIQQQRYRESPTHGLKIARAKSYSTGDTVEKQRKGKSPRSVSLRKPTRTKTTLSVDADWTIPDLNAKPRKATVKEVLGGKSEKRRLQKESRETSRRPARHEPSNSPVPLDRFDDLDRQIALIEEELSIASP